MNLTLSAEKTPPGAVAGLPWAPVCPPSLPQPAHRLLALCDEAGLRHLVHLHMKRLRHTPLFARSGRCFDCVAQRVADFVVEACGGPLYFSERHTRLMAGAGLPLLLDTEGREIWLVQLWHAFDDADLPWPLRADYWGWAEPLSVHLVAPHARHPGLTRYPYDTVRSWFTASGADEAGMRHGRVGASVLAEGGTQFAVNPMYNNTQRKVEPCQTSDTN